MEEYMIYRDLCGERVSLLGFGAMRLPTLGSPDKINAPEAERIIDYAISQGVNYFDTAFPYHGGHSETVVGEILKKYPRESYYLATKFPGHQVMKSYNPAAIFEQQLAKCGVDYFDFYLLHNVNESSVDTYLNPEFGIIDYFLEQKRLGRIRHLGFSTHASVDCLTQFLDQVGDSMEFCQIQLNYLDYTLQRAGEKCDILNARGIPIIVMEPVRGGKLAAGLPEVAKEKLLAARPDESVASWCFRWLERVEGVKLVLSGMSNMDQVVDNIRTYSTDLPLRDGEVQLLLDIAEGLKRSIPCTGCRYCTDVCPMGLNIPLFIEVYNDIKYSPGVNSSAKVELMPDDKKPTVCIGCGACTNICPQRIDVPKALSALTEALKNIPSWREISLERERAAERNMINNKK